MTRWEDLTQDISKGLARSMVWAGFVFEVYELGTVIETPFVWIIRAYENAPKLFSGRAHSFKHAEQCLFESIADYLTQTASGFSIIVSGGVFDLDKKDAGALIRTGRVTVEVDDGHYQIDARFEGGSH